MNLRTQNSFGTGAIPGVLICFSAPSAPFASFTKSSGVFPGCLPRPVRAAFTLIELILVMAILTMAVSLTAPALSNFFRGRSLNSEAQRLLALTHGGQSRAVSEGIPMDLWVDSANGTYGLEAEPSFETTDPHAADFKLDSGLQIDTSKPPAILATQALTPGQMVSTASVLPIKLAHPTLPTIRFLPDGTIGQTSPTKLVLTARDGSSLALVQNTNSFSYEIRDPEK